MDNVEFNTEKVSNIGKFPPRKSQSLLRNFSRHLCMQLLVLLARWISPLVRFDIMVRQCVEPGELERDREWTCKKIFSDVCKSVLTRRTLLLIIHGPGAKNKKTYREKYLKKCAQLFSSGTKWNIQQEVLFTTEERLEKPTQRSYEKLFSHSSLVSMVVVVVSLNLTGKLSDSQTFLAQFSRVWVQFNQAGHITS